MMTYSEVGILDAFITPGRWPFAARRPILAVCDIRGNNCIAFNDPLGNFSVEHLVDFAAHCIKNGRDPESEVNAWIKTGAVEPIMAIGYHPTEIGMPLNELPFSMEWIPDKSGNYLGGKWVPRTKITPSPTSPIGDRKHGGNQGEGVGE